MKKIMLSCLFLVVMLSLTACNNTSDTSQTLETSVEKEQNVEEDTKKEIDEDISNNETQESSSRLASITIYYSNDDATAFTSEEVQINSLSPEEVLNALIEKGAIAADVEILSFETTTVDGKATILLDFNDAFASYISSMGSTGEYFVMGSICNTFLDAYDCEQIQVTVDGDTLSTGHAEYPGYMTTFS